MPTEQKTDRQIIDAIVAAEQKRTDAIRAKLTAVVEGEKPSAGPTLDALDELQAAIDAAIQHVAAT